MLLLLGLAGLQLLGLVIDVIRHALDPTQRAPVYPFGWTPPPGWTPLHIVTVMALAIVVQAMLRAVLTYHYNMTTARLTQGKIVPGPAGPRLCQAATAELPLLRRARLQLDLQPGDGRRAEYAPVRGRRGAAGGQHGADAGGVSGVHVAHPCRR